VTAEAAIAAILARLSDAQVVALADACSSAPAPSPALSATVAGAPPATTEAVNFLRTAWEATPGLTGAGITLALRTGLAARQAADQRRTRPAWTGPGASGEQRLTAGVIHELLAGARERILLVSYATYTLPAIANDLRAAAERGCRVDVVFETTADSDGAYKGPATPFAEVPGLTRWRWPKEKRTAGAVLHAKVLVVDGRAALVGSANLTDRALSANLEVGLLTRDPELAAAIEAHIRELCANGTLITAL